MTVLKKKIGTPKVVMPKDETEVETPIETPTNNEPEFNPPSAEQSFSPFAEAPIIRDSGIISGKQQADTGQPLSQEVEIPEPDFTPNVEQLVSTEGINKGIVEGATETQPVNPAMAELSQAEQRKAAEAFAKVLVSAYGAGTKEICMAIAKPPKKKINKLVQTKELDPSVQIETMDGTKTFAAWVDVIGENVETAFEQSDEFIENIMSPLTEVLLEKGVGLTPMQQVMYYVGMDLFQKGKAVFQIRGMMSELIDHTKELTVQLGVNSVAKDKAIAEKDRELAELRRQINNQDPNNIQEPEVVHTIKIDEGDQ